MAWGFCYLRIFKKKISGRSLQYVHFRTKNFQCAVLLQKQANCSIRHLEFLRNFNKSFRTFKALTNNLP
jgi:hypothetical protein